MFKVNLIKECLELIDEFDQTQIDNEVEILESMIQAYEDTISITEYMSPDNPAVERMCSNLGSIFQEGLVPVENNQQQNNQQPKQQESNSDQKETKDSKDDKTKKLSPEEVKEYNKTHHFRKYNKSGVMESKVTSILMFIIRLIALPIKLLVNLSKKDKVTKVEEKVMNLTEEQKQAGEKMLKEKAGTDLGNGISINEKGNVIVSRGESVIEGNLREILSRDPFLDVSNAFEKVIAAVDKGVMNKTGSTIVGDSYLKHQVKNQQKTRGAGAENFGSFQAHEEKVSKTQSFLGNVGINVKDKWVSKALSKDVADRTKFIKQLEKYQKTLNTYEADYARRLDQLKSGNAKLMRPGEYEELNRVFQGLKAADKFLSEEIKKYSNDARMTIDLYERTLQLMYEEGIVGYGKQYMADEKAAKKKKEAEEKKKQAEQQKEEFMNKDGVNGPVYTGTK